MAGRIKGITVEIGGDTTGLEKALKNVNSTIKNTQSQLKDVNRLLKLDPSNTELLSQKQRALKDAIGATKEKLDSLKTAQEQAKQQLENGAACRRKPLPQAQRLPRSTRPEKRWRLSETPSPAPVRRSCPLLWLWPVSARLL